MKTKLTYILLSLIIAFGCKKKKEEPTENIASSCLLTKEIQRVDGIITENIEYQYDSFGRIIKQQNLNQEGVFTDSSTYIFYTYEGNKIVSAKQNAQTQIGKSDSEPTTYNSGYPYYLTEYNYRNDTLISSISRHFREPNDGRIIFKTRSYYLRGNLSAFVIIFSALDSSCKYGIIDSLVFTNYLNSRPQTKIEYISEAACPSIILRKTTETKYTYDGNMNLIKTETAFEHTGWVFNVTEEFAYDLSIPNIRNMYTFSTNPKDTDRNLRISEKRYSSYNCFAPNSTIYKLYYSSSDVIKLKNKNGLPELIESTIYSTNCGKEENYKIQKSFEYGCK